MSSILLTHDKRVAQLASASVERQVRESIIQKEGVYNGVEMVQSQCHPDIRVFKDRAIFERPEGGLAVVD